MLMWATRLYLLVTNVITLGRREKPKVLKSSKRRAQGSVDFCISHLLYGFKKTGDRGQLNIHIIWGYIQSLGFKLLDERQLWINVIFSLTYRHLLRVREGKKKSLCALPLLIFPITLPWGSLSRWNARQWLSNVTDCKIFIYRNEVSTDLHFTERSRSCAPLPWGSREKFGQRWLERNLFVEQGENKKNTHIQTPTHTHGDEGRLSKGWAAFIC